MTNMRTVVAATQIVCTQTGRQWPQAVFSFQKLPANQAPGEVNLLPFLQTATRSNKLRGAESVGQGKEKLKC